MTEGMNNFEQQLVLVHPPEGVKLQETACASGVGQRSHQIEKHQSTGIYFLNKAV